MINTTTAIRSLAVAGLAAAAVASQALTFTTEQIGNVSSVSGTTYSTTFDVFATSGAATFSTGTLVYTEVAPSSFTGTFFITDKAGDSLTYALTGTYYTVAGADSLSGTATLTSGTGIYKGYTGVGTLANQTLLTAGSTFGAFTSSVQAAPEPISTAIIIGALGTAIAKRRKKA